MDYYYLFRPWKRARKPMSDARRRRPRNPVVVPFSLPTLAVPSSWGIRTTFPPTKINSVFRERHISRQARVSIEHAWACLSYISYIRLCLFIFSNLPPEVVRIYAPQTAYIGPGSTERGVGPILGMFLSKLN